MDTPIGDYGLISDCHSAALVSRSGSVDWLCWPRFDRPSIFARLLDDDGGHFSIRPSSDARSSRRYVEDTMVLETTFESSAGTVVLTDALAIGKNERGHELGADSPHVLMRKVECTQGQVDIEVEYAPRTEYGLVQPLMVAHDGAIRAQGGADVLVLATPVPLDLGVSGADGRVTLGAGDTLSFALHYSTTSEPEPQAWSSAAITDRLADTVAGWKTWSEMHQGYEGPWRDLVWLSGRVLQALTYQPTGAIVAAPTTSLPEDVGGERNWDYRYAWIRDASLTLVALWVAACPDESHYFLKYMTGAAASEIGRGYVQIMFGVGGEHDLSERALPHLKGWRNSSPVRIGNGAWDQRQLDVYGELLNAIYRLSDVVGELDDPTRDFLGALVDAAAANWEDPDHGIWEMRGEPQHFLHSKLMCWVALDRGIELAARLGAEDKVEAWSKVRDEIGTAILERGWSDEAGAFTQALGSTELDASVLMMPIVGFIDAKDDRMLSTIAAIEDRLTDDHGLVFRYRSPDGLEGEEGTFLLCTFWLAQAYALSAQVERAKETFERAAAFVNDLGLLAEEVDPETGELLGNFPQAFSHVGLVNAAWAISQAEKGLTPGGGPL